MSRKDIFIQSFDKILFKHHFLRIMSIGNGPKMTHFSCLIFDVISLSDIVSSLDPKSQTLSHININNYVCICLFGSSFNTCELRKTDVYNVCISASKWLLYIYKL